MQTPLKLTTRLAEGEVFRFDHVGQTVARCSLKDGLVSVAVRYDFTTEPLTLIGEGRADDSVQIILLPWRIELWINGQLMDEEWPCGQHSLESAELIGVCEMEEYTPRENIRR